METNNLEKSIKEIFDGQYKYIIPLYQRNFSWRQEQIEQLLQDIYEAYKNKQGNYFIGSLVVLKRPNGDFEVIDGQQRLTTLSLITKILGINDEPRLFYDSRPEVEEFFKVFYKSDDEKCEINYPQIYHLKNAIRYIKDAKLDAESNSTTINQMDNNSKESFKTFFAEHVILVRVEIPQDTDVASYFEIMNNRGEQLQKHEILKSLMMSKLDNKCKQKEFALIWDACSQMDIPIQKLFKAGDKDKIGTRNRYFGNEYDGFCFEGLMNFDDCDNVSLEKDELSIHDIIKNSFRNNHPNENDDKKEDDNLNTSELKYKSIIDFPNFLMHVFKVMFSNDNIDIPLNEKYLLLKYNELENVKKINPEDFIYKLLFCRTVFDRYIVKTTVDTNDKEDGEKWALIKPKKYTQNWDYIGTFEDDNNKQNRINNKQNRIIKALSMLQVTYRTRVYKNWMYEILNWFSNEKQSIEISYEDYVKKLDEIILNEYDRLGVEQEINKDNPYSLGPSTPHFLFNFIDYLYWVDSRNKKSIFDNTPNPKGLNDFNFKYWNSVEHHLAQKYAEDIDKDNFKNYIDNLGNLCLISKNANSSLSDRSVKDKVERSTGNLGANRQIMYKITKDKGNDWKEKEIIDHYKELLNLIHAREKILEHQNTEN